MTQISENQDAITSALKEQQATESEQEQVWFHLRRNMGAWPAKPINEYISDMLNDLRR